MIIVSCEYVDLIPISAIEEARRVIAGKAIRTPLVRLNLLDARAEIYLKLENLQPIGSFKIRGAANAIARLSPERLQRGVVTASAGNMAQGVAWCARAWRALYGDRAVISARREGVSGGAAWWSRDQGFVRRVVAGV